MGGAGRIPQPLSRWLVAAPAWIWIGVLVIALASYQAWQVFQKFTAG